MVNRDGSRAQREVRPHVPTLQADPLLRHSYGRPLEAAAEHFLIHAFEHGGRGPLGEESVPPMLIAAAMHILNRTAWTQPSDEQVKAAMYLTTRHADGDADEEQPGRRAA